MMLAERTAATDGVDAGQEILAQAAESFATPGSWQVLSDFQRRHGRGEDAARSLERAAELAGGGDDSLRFAHLGAALVSNSREHGEEVMRKALDFVESSYDLRLHDSQIHTELF